MKGQVGRGTHRTGESWGLPAFQRAVLTPSRQVWECDRSVKGPGMGRKQPGALNERLVKWQ